MFRIGDTEVPEEPVHEVVLEASSSVPESPKLTLSPECLLEVLKDPLIVSILNSYGCKKPAVTIGTSTSSKYF